MYFILLNHPISLSDATTDEIDASGENQKPYADSDNSLEIEPDPEEKFSCHMDSMKRYKKQVSRNSESMNREEGKGEVGV